MNGLRQRLVAADRSNDTLAGSRADAAVAVVVNWLRSHEAEAVLIAHQRATSAACSCGWAKWGHSHAAHVLEALAERLEEAP
jgi:hypothetical protein